MSRRASKFWADDHRHTELARKYYEGIEYTDSAYQYVTSRRMCPCLKYANKCAFPLNGKVSRIRHRGESV